MDMLSIRQMQQGIQRGIFGSGPWPGAGDPAGRPTTDWLDSFLPIADAADAGLLYADLRDGDHFGCIWEWYPEGGGDSAPRWAGIDEMIDDVASALVEGRPALQTYANGAIWPESRLQPQLPEVDEGYLRWSAA